MTEEGRLKRGKENYERGRFLDNPETLAYVATIPKEGKKPKEAKEDAKPTK